MQRTNLIARRPGERGAALTEFAIVAPLFIAMIYGSLYLMDVGVFKLKAQEIARFGAWSFAQHPLSNYEDEAFSHSDNFNEARDKISDDLYEVYFDLDGANDRFLPVPGAWSKTMSAQYIPPTTSDLRNRPVQMLPSWAQADWSSPLSTIGMVLSLLGFGTGTESFVSGPFQRLKLNRSGQVTARSKVILLPPIRPDDARQALAMARVGRERDADLSAWMPVGRDIRDTGGGRIEQTLVVDSWKVHDGASAHPKSRRGYANILQEISDNGINALPGGQIIAFITGLTSQLRELPNGLSQLLGFPPDDPAGHLLTRPYTTGRDPQPHYTGPVRTGSGQVDIFDYTGAREPQESGAVTNFETGPLFFDPANPGSSPYLESLNTRGNHFMGCPDSEERGCWE